MATTATAPASPVQLGKRKRISRYPPLVLHLSGGSRSSLSPGLESESALDTDFVPDESDAAETPIAGPSNVSRTPSTHLSKAVYKCSFEGCSKSYRKPSRLQEHERSHTGDRPFTCTTCSKGYLRESHLQAHVRSHLPASDRPLACQFPGCEKRFWTSQHLKAHSNLHTGDKPFKCDHDGCTSSFSKHSQLRLHIASAHSPPGTNAHPCEHPGCTKSFVSNSKLQAHLLTHEAKRYTCVHPSCSCLPEQEFFATWSALQAHMRNSHPPTCPYESCNGKTFTASKGLRAHLKIHEQRQLEEVLHQDETTDGALSRKRRRGGEVGRDWKCEVDGCDKDFKSQKALRVHHNVTHLKRRDFQCSHDSCGMSFGYKHLLQRHLSKAHPSTPPSSLAEIDDQYSADDELGAEPTVPQWSAVDVLTGKAYGDAAERRVTDNKALRCPYPHFPECLSLGGVSTAQVAQKRCEYAFSRAYDLRRHLSAVHDLRLEKGPVEEWVRSEKMKISRSA